MKTVKCKQLGGPENCNVEFHAETFDEVAEQSKKHAHEMYKQNDVAHLKAMEEMMKIMKSQEKMKEWMDDRKKEFDELPEE